MSTAMRQEKAGEPAWVEQRTPTDAAVLESKAANAAVAGRRPSGFANDNADPVRRHPDGSLDVGHYRMRARELRGEAFARFITWIGEELLGGARRKS